MTREMDELLRKEMEYKRLGYNAFVTSILTKYLEWDRFAEKFGFVQFSVELLEQLLEEVDEETIERIANKSARATKEAVLFYHKRLTLETFLEFLFTTLKYAYLGLVHYDSKPEAGTQTVTIRHHFGEKWSKLFADQTRKAFEHSLGVKAACEATSHQVVITFPT